MMKVDRVIQMHRKDEKTAKYLHKRFVTARAPKEFELSQTLLHPENVFSQMTAKIFQQREEAYLSTLHHFPPRQLKECS